MCFKKMEIVKNKYSNDAIITVNTTFSKLTGSKVRVETVAIEKKDLKHCSQNAWIYFLFAGLILFPIICLSLIAMGVYLKNKAMEMRKEIEMKNSLYGTEYYDGSEITEKNPSYGLTT